MPPGYIRDDVVPHAEFRGIWTGLGGVVFDQAFGTHEQVLVSRRLKISEGIPGRVAELAQPRRHEFHEQDRLLLVLEHGMTARQHLAFRAFHVDFNQVGLLDARRLDEHIQRDHPAFEGLDYGRVVGFANLFNRRNRGQGVCTPPPGR